MRLATKIMHHSTGITQFTNMIHLTSPRTENNSPILPHLHTRHRHSAAGVYYLANNGALAIYQQVPITRQEFLL